MTRIIRPSNSRKFSHRHLESLELRGLLSNLPVIASLIPGGPQLVPPGTVAYAETLSSVGPITSEPANASNVPTGPDQLVITFDRPVNTFDLGLFDIRLDRVEGDGTTTSVFDPSNWPQLVANNNDGFDPTFTTLTIPLNGPLADGHYQIVLVGGSLISSDISDGQWDPFSDYVFSDFTVGSGGVEEERGSPKDPVTSSYLSQNPGTVVTGLKDLGTLPVTSAIEPDSFSPIPGNGVAKLYRFEVPQGHHWQVGIGAQILNSNGSFLTSMGLYRIDPDGNLTQIPLVDQSTGITRTAVHGLTYVGLDSGEYCLAVTGTFTGVSSNGEYQLQLTASPADQPVRVSDFQLNWIRKTDPAPAGLTIQFTGPVSLSPFGKSYKGASPLQVVDTAGRLWSVLPFNYDATTNSLTLVFGDQLPAGTYYLKIGKTNALTDLAGWTPKMDGLPSGYLATWTVSPASESVQPSNLGVVWPLADGPISRTEELSIGATHSYIFDVIVPCFYKLQSTVSSGITAFQILSYDGVTLFDSLATRGFNNNLIHLEAGSYRLVITGRSLNGASLSWTLATQNLGGDSLLDNGVGQWSAQTFGSMTGAEGLNSKGYAGPSQQSANSSISASNFAASQATTLASPPLLTPLASAPLGSPTSQSISVGVVGPSVEAGLVTVADNTRGLLTGIQYASSSRSLVLSASPTPRLDHPSPDADAAELIELTELSTVDADRDALASTEWIMGIGRFVENFLNVWGKESSTASDSGDRRIQLDELATSERIEATKDLNTRDERASMELPLGILVTAAVACRVKEPIRRWWRKDHRGRGTSTLNHNASTGNGRQAGPRGPSRFGHGPHFGIRRRSALTSRTARKSHEG